MKALKWYVTDKESSSVQQYHNRDEAIKQAKLRVNADYSQQEGEYFYKVEGPTKTLFVLGEPSISKYGFKNISHKPQYSTLNKSQLLQEIKKIEYEEGPDYFVMPGCTTSQKYTGLRDYWQLAYIIHSEGVRLNSSLVITRKHDLERHIDEVGIKRVVAVDIIVRRVIDNDITDTTQLLGRVKGPKYRMYKHKL